MRYCPDILCTKVTLKIKICWVECTELSGVSGSGYTTTTFGVALN